MWINVKLKWMHQYQYQVPGDKVLYKYSYSNTNTSCNMYGYDNSVKLVFVLRWKSKKHIKNYQENWNSEKGILKYAMGLIKSSVS